MSRLLVSLLFEVDPADLVTLLGVGATIIVVAMLAAYVPARRATRVDPLESLRAD